MKKTPDRVLQVMAPTPPIRMGGQRPGGATRVDILSRLFLRVLAVLWFVEGAVQWLAVLQEPGPDSLRAASSLHVTALFFFCILDFVAAVGLWLLASWGVAVWLATIVGQVVVAALGGGVLMEPVLLLTGDAVLVAAQGALAWSRWRERRRR